jgi:hypothetical protein
VSWDHPRPNAVRIRRVLALLPRRIEGRWVWMRRYTLVERFEFVEFDFYQENDRYEWRAIARRLHSEVGVPDGQ